MLRSLALVRAIAVAGAAALAAASPVAPVLPSSSDSWIRVETPDFTIFSDASPSKAKEIALELERFRAVLLQIKPSHTENAPVPTTLFVFKTDAAMNPYKPRIEGKPRNGSGFFLPGTDGNYLALAAAWNTDPRRVIYHEYFHYFMRSNFAPQPLWYEEGAAEFYSTFRSSGNEAEIGRPVSEHVGLLRNAKMLPLFELFRVGHRSADYNEAAKQGVFYAESWALVHYLLRGEPKRTPEFGRFLVMLQQGRPTEEAFQEAFHVDPEELLHELGRYVRQDRYLFTRAKFADLKVSEEVKVFPVPWEDAVAELGGLDAHGQEEMLPDAEVHFQAVLAQRPAHAGALAGMGLVRLRLARYEEAAEFFQKAIDAGSTDFRVSFRLGELRMRALAALNSGRLEPASRRTLEEARAAFRQSVERNPHFPEARAALGRSYLFEEGANAREGIPDLEAAVRELPNRTDLALDLATLYARTGEAAKSEAIAKKVLGPDAIFARESRSDDLLSRVNLLLEQHKEGEAVGLLEQIVAKSQGEMRVELESQLKSLRKGIARNQSVRDFNEALARWKRQDLDGALALFRQVAESAEDSVLRKSAAEQAEQLDRALAQKKSRKPN